MRGWRLEVGETANNRVKPSPWVVSLGSARACSGAPRGCYPTAWLLLGGIVCLSCFYRAPLPSPACYPPNPRLMPGGLSQNGVDRHKINPRRIAAVSGVFFAVHPLGELSSGKLQ